MAVCCIRGRLSVTPCLEKSGRLSTLCLLLGWLCQCDGEGRVGLFRIYLTTTVRTLKLFIFFVVCVGDMSLICPIVRIALSFSGHRPLRSRM